MERPAAAVRPALAARASPRIQQLVDRFQDNRSQQPGPGPGPGPSRSRASAPATYQGSAPSSKHTSTGPTKNGYHALTEPANQTPLRPGLPHTRSGIPFQPGTTDHDTAQINSQSVPNEESASQPVPASLVFSRLAPALNLPALDRYLACNDIFSPPHFSDPRVRATKEERSLFGWDAASRSKGKKAKQRKWEIAGGQISALTSSESHKHLPEGDSQSFELDTDTSRISKTSSLPSYDSSSRYSALDGKDDDATLTDQRPLLPTSLSFSSARTETTGVPSQLSSASRPITRRDMFPPLMLLKEQSLDELKSNAVGPRAPPGGFFAIIPPVQKLLGTVTDLLIGVEGSSFAAGILRLETLRDFAQVLQNNISWSNAAPATTPPGMAAKIKMFFFHTLPSILALDFVSLLGRAQVFMVLWMVVGALMLWRFWRVTKAYDHNRYVDGFDSRPSAYTTPPRGTKTGYVLLVFGLTTAYIPLTKLAVDVLVWNIDFWVMNPLADMNDMDDLPKDLPPLGDSDHFRDPLDFCYTTTVRKDKFNFAWLLVPAAVLTILFFTIWLPIRMIQVLRRMVPHVSEHNELGTKRSPEEMDLEYRRLLGKDKSPLNFMINGYRRQWAFYKPVYILCFKLTNVLIISVLNRNNCIWRFNHTKTMLLIQQAVLIAWMSTLLGIHIVIKPFVDMISNRSEMVSRTGYVLTAILGLLVALNVNGGTVYRSTILYIVQGFSYAFNIYFTLAGTALFEHAVKRAQNRLDFSIDIFSPALDMQKHIRRRIWEETFSTILLAAPPYRMPVDQVVAFSTSDADDWPPYLLNFQNTAAERHVENIKLVRELGHASFRDFVELERGHVAHRWRAVVKKIQISFTGPDAYWRPIRPPFPEGVSSFFGKAFVIPFPPTIVVRYDQGGNRTMQLTTLEEFETFAQQNEDHLVRQARRIRLALRSLDGQRVYCPYVKVEDVYENTGMFGRKPRRHNYSVAVPVTYVDGILQVRHRDPFPPPGAYNFSSGFEVSIVYEEGLREDAAGSARVHEPIVVSGSAAFELFDDFRSSAGLATFLSHNQVLVKSRFPVVDKLMEAYRAKYYDEARRKTGVMSYSFLTDIFSNHRLRCHELERAFERASCSEVVRQLPVRYASSIASLYERLEAVCRSEVHRWWWLFWDDLWRRNYRDVAALRKHRVHFCPSFPTSIAYQPLPRAQLELFLTKYGMWNSGGTAGFIHTGTLNSVYFYLDELVFGHGVSHLRSKAIKLGIGSDQAALKAHHIDSLGLPDHSRGAGTGGGTDYERSDIIDRRAKRWEMLMSGRPSLSRSARAWNGLLEWLNLRPLKVDGQRQSLFLYLSLKDGGYELPGEEALQREAGDSSSSNHDHLANLRSSYDTTLQRL
ncbi:unnamed protein product [Tilletia controversa]|nr:unnamed protein product [Tilletia controversa]CAD6961579.1 unnamed protein product [Tilletia controversa]CAD6976153.1 unnamed protein product [Tilletia controversa]